MTRNRDHERPVAILLAAGMSRRFGRENKLLHRLDGESLVVRAFRALQAAGLPVVAVTGHQRERVEMALGALMSEADRFVFNARFEEGMGTSVACGVKSEPNASGWLIALGDMPRLSVATIGRLLVSGPLAACSCAGHPSPPAFFDARFGPELMHFEGDVGARHLLVKHADLRNLIEVDPAELLDFNVAASQSLQQL